MLLLLLLLLTIKIMHTNHVPQVLCPVGIFLFSMVPDDLNTWMSSWTHRPAVRQSHVIILSACGLVLSACWHLSKQQIWDSEFMFQECVVHVFTSMYMCVLKDVLAVLPGVHKVVLANMVSQLGMTFSQYGHIHVTNAWNKDKI